MDVLCLIRNRNCAQPEDGMRRRATWVGLKAAAMQRCDSVTRRNGDLIATVPSTYTKQQVSAIDGSRAEYEISVGSHIHISP
jgi:hypothetical protein